MTEHTPQKKDSCETLSAGGSPVTTDRPDDFHKTPYLKGRLLLAPALVLCLGCILSFWVGHLIELPRQKQLADAMASQQHMIEAELERNLSQYSKAIERMAVRLETSANWQAETWASDALAYIQHYDAIPLIAFIDTNGQAQIVRKQGIDSGEIQSKQLTSLQSNFKPNITEIIKTNQSQLVEYTGWSGFKQHGLTLMSPVSRMDGIQGVVAAVISSTDLINYETVGLTPSVNLTIHSGGESLYQRYPGTPTHEANTLIQHGHIATLGRTLQLTCWPTDEWLATRKSILPTTVMVWGVIGSILMASLIWMIQRSTDTSQKLRHIIQDQRTAREALSHSQTQLRLALEVANLGVWEWNIATNTTHFNDTWYQMLGYAPNELPMTFEAWEQLVHPDDLPNAKNMLEKHCNNDGPYHFQHRMKAKDGTWKWIQTCGKVIEWDESGEPVRMAGVHYDIDTLRRTTDELREGEARFRNAFEEGAIGIALVSPEGRWLKVNPKLCEMLGYSETEMLATDFQTITHPDDLDNDLEQLNQLLTGESTGYHLEKRYHHKDGSVVFVLLSVTLVRDIDGKPIHCIAQIQDITSQKATQAELAEARDQAQDANRAKSEFLANMSHEIRTPMNGVIGALELLCDTKLSEDQQDLAKIAQRSADALLSIINDILDLSKIESGKLDFEEIDFDLLDVIEPLADVFAPRIGEQGLSFGLLVDPNTPTALRGDPGRLRQVLVNLVSNAVKFTMQGAITVKVKKIEKRGERTRLGFSVIDTGPGIEIEQRDALFAPFTQADSSTTRRFGGTGLGLSIAASLVKLMGGEMRLESVPDIGSRFDFDLWFNESDTQENAGHSKLEGRRLLVVDDNNTNLSIIVRQLTHFGIESEACRDAKRALILLRQAVTEGRPFDACLIDRNMPNIDGLEAAKLFREDSALSNLPLVLVTSVTNTNVKQEAIDAGMAGYIFKPLKQRDLYTRLLAILDGESIANLGLTSDESSQNTSGQTKNNASSLAGRKILLAEDNPVNQRVTGRQLAQFGLETTIASNGRIALEYLEQDTFDLVLLDCQMPEMDGYDACREIRRRQRQDDFPNFPIIAVTAHAMRGDREKCLAAGMDDVLTKPVRVVRLEQVLNRWLNIEQQDKPTQQLIVEAEIEAEHEIDQTIINRDMFFEMIGSDPESQAEIIKDFETQIEKQYQELCEAARSHDMERAAKVLHTLKGGVGTLGAQRACEHARSIEALAKAGNEEALLAELASLYDDLHNAEHLMHDLLKNPPRPAA